MLNNKKILLAVTGSIAAYKSALLVRLLIKNGAEVQVLMTKAAEDFITPLTLSTLSKKPVLTHLFDANTWANHVALGRWADVLVVAPASCNTIAKMANGLCDNLLLAVYLSATCPVVVVPAMDEDMWQHKSTLQNLKLLQTYGNRIIPVNDGELASGLIGMGRMAEPEAIILQLQQMLINTQSLLHKKILITAGPTHEPIDPVRYIGNHSTGKMGIALAIACKQKGADVHIILGPTTATVPANIKVTHVQTAAQMYEACMAEAATYHLAILAAAVADYTATTVQPNKIKKTETSLTLQLSQTTDILKKLGQIKLPEQILVGFALETDNELHNAQQKLKNKNADYIVLNSLNDAGTGFGYDNNKVTILSKEGLVIPFDKKPKAEVAEDILNTILKSKHETSI